MCQKHMVQKPISSSAPKKKKEKNERIKWKPMRFNNAVYGLCMCVNKLHNNVTQRPLKQNK